MTTVTTESNVAVGAIDALHKAVDDARRASVGLVKMGERRAVSQSEFLVSKNKAVDDGRIGVGVFHPLANQGEAARHLRLLTRERREILIERCGIVPAKQDVLPVLDLNLEMDLRGAHAIDHRIRGLRGGDGVAQALLNVARADESDNGERGHEPDEPGGQSKQPGSDLY